MNNKEKNFVSAVFYLHNDAERVVPFVSELNAQLDAHFDQYELVAVTITAPTARWTSCGSGPRVWQSPLPFCT